MQNHRTTGFSSTPFATLLKALNNHLIWSKSDQKLRKIALNQALKMMLIYHRYNSTEKFLVDISASLNPHINLIEKALLEILKPMVKPLEKSTQHFWFPGGQWNAHTSMELTFTRSNGLFRKA